MCSSCFALPGNWYLLVYCIAASVVASADTNNQGWSETRDEQKSHLHSMKCIMAEGNGNTDIQDCSIDTESTSGRQKNAQTKPPDKVVVRPGDGWPGESGQHLRSPLARTIYQKMREDELNRNSRHDHWYRVVVPRLAEDVKKLYLPMAQDEGTDDFLENCQEKSDQIFPQIFYSIAKPVLSLFMTQTSINGFLNRGSMFIFSKSQFEKIMGYSGYHKGENLLDLGAGDGMVTLQMSPYFNNTYATEMSSTMVQRLTGHGFKVLGVKDWHESRLQFDLIACLNLLDRCDKPMSLLADIRRKLKPGVGRVLVAVVIPFRPYVEFESKTNKPTEHLRVEGNSFEEEVNNFVKLFHQSGFEVERFTRLPYLCEGDLKHSFYILTDALFVLKLQETPSLLQISEPPS